MKIKALLTIFIVLLIGFVFGFLTSDQIRRHEWKKKHKHTYQEIFVCRNLKIISPAESQKDTVLPIIEQYAEKSLALKNEVSAEFDSIIHEMNQELKPFVNKDQYARLVEEAEKTNYRRK
jgi:hypothetical protein